MSGPKDSGAGKALLAEAMGMYDWLVDIRRMLHRIPEPGNEEFETSDTICRILDELKIAYERKGTSVVALLEGAMQAEESELSAESRKQSKAI